MYFNVNFKIVFNTIVHQLVNKNNFDNIKMQDMYVYMCTINCTINIGIENNKIWLYIELQLAQGRENEDLL